MMAKSIFDTSTWNKLQSIPAKISFPLVVVESLAMYRYVTPQKVSLTLGGRLLVHLS
jgi:hypothetical protein